jgi:hypothetical protein
MDGWMNGWMDEWMDGQMDGWPHLPPDVDTLSQSLQTEFGEMTSLLWLIWDLTFYYFYLISHQDLNARGCHSTVFPYSMLDFWFLFRNWMSWQLCAPCTCSHVYHSPHPSLMFTSHLLHPFVASWEQKGIYIWFLGSNRPAYWEQKSTLSIFSVFWGERHHGRRSELGIEMLAGTSLGSALAHLRDWAFSFLGSGSLLCSHLSVSFLHRLRESF